MASSSEEDELISMEEGSNTSVNLQQTPSQTETRQPPSDKIIQSASLRNKFQSLKHAVSQDEQVNDKPKVGECPKIQKASTLLRQNKKIKKYFEPIMVSIGPLHHGDKFNLAEELKLQLAALFIKKHMLDELELYNRINGQIDSLRKCYIEKGVEKFNNEDLAWMFLVDGCALIHYIDCDSNEKLRGLKIKMDMEAFAQQDLFLLENQLPYQLLDRVLINSMADHKDQDAVRESISEFVDKIARNIRGPSDDVDAGLWKSVSKFIYGIIRGPPSSPSAQSSRPPLPNPPAHLLDLLWRHLVGYNAPSQHPESDNRCLSLRACCKKSSQKPNPDNLYTFRNVNELKAAWIRFKSNKSDSFGDIAFNSYWFAGILRLPSLAVDDSTEPMFLNLIAFEMCPDFENDFPVSSYISFLDSLIDQSDDVKDLRKAHILYNALGSDEDVARLFNEIGTDVVPNPQTYSIVKHRIQWHYKKKWSTWIWMGHSFHDQFSSPPWKILAFAGAIIALFLSAVQTWFTVYPRK